MKRIMFLALGLFVAFALNAQDTPQRTEEKEMKTLFGSDVSHGGYGAITFGFSQINDEDAWLVGGRGAWIINHSFALGIAGYGFANDIYLDEVIDGNDNLSLVGGYGGLLFEPIFFSREAVHFTVPILVGAGGISEAPEYYWQQDHYWDDRVLDTDAYFVIEPGLEVEVNLTRFMRFGAGAAYRYTSEIDLPHTDADVLDGFSGYFSLKFGKF